MGGSRCWLSGFALGDMVWVRARRGAVQLLTNLLSE